MFLKLNSFFFSKISILQIFSTSKEYVSAASSFPDRYTHKLEKGDYVVKVQMRSANEAVLGKFADSPLLWVFFSIVFILLQALLENVGTIFSIFETFFEDYLWR